MPLISVIRNNKSTMPKTPKADEASALPLNLIGASADKLAAGYTAVNHLENEERLGLVPRGSDAIRTQYIFYTLRPLYTELIQKQYAYYILLFRENLTS